MKMWKSRTKLISFILIMVAVLMTTSVFASFAGNPDSSAYWQKAKDDSVGEASYQIQQRGTKILNAFVWFGYAIALGMVVYIGIKYMLGAADARASMKSAIVGWLIGALIVFMATTITGWVLGVIGESKNSGVNDIANDVVHALD